MSQAEMVTVDTGEQLRNIREIAERVSYEFFNNLLGIFESTQNASETVFEIFLQQTKVICTNMVLFMDKQKAQECYMAYLKSQLICLLAMENEYISDMINKESQNYFKQWIPIDDGDSSETKKQKTIIHDFISETITLCRSEKDNLSLQDKLNASVTEISILESALEKKPASAFRSENAKLKLDLAKHKDYCEKNHAQPTSENHTDTKTDNLDKESSKNNKIMPRKSRPNGEKQTNNNCNETLIISRNLDNNRGHRRKIESVKKDEFNNSRISLNDDIYDEIYKKKYPVVKNEKKIRDTRKDTVLPKVVPTEDVNRKIKLDEKRHKSSSSKHKLSKSETDYSENEISGRQVILGPNNDTDSNVDADYYKRSTKTNKNRQKRYDEHDNRGDEFESPNDSQDGKQYKHQINKKKTSNSNTNNGKKSAVDYSKNGYSINARSNCDITSNSYGDHGKGRNTERGYKSYATDIYSDEDKRTSRIKSISKSTKRECNSYTSDDKEIKVERKNPSKKSKSDERLNFEYNKRDSKNHDIYDRRSVSRKYQEYNRSQDYNETETSQQSELDEMQANLNRFKEKKGQKRLTPKNVAPRKYEPTRKENILGYGANVKSESNWLTGQERYYWDRPCFANYNFVVLGDSQLKIFGQKRILKKGYNIMAYSGADVVELINVLEVGFLPAERKGCVSNLNRRNVEICNEYTLCAICGDDCMESYNGHVIIAIGLNNVLKADGANFRGQSISECFAILEGAIDRLVPNSKSVFYIPPIKVDRELSYTSEDIYNRVCHEVYKRKHSRVKPDYPFKNGWISAKDGVHLIDKAAEEYWNENFYDIEKQLQNPKCLPKS